MQWLQSTVGGEIETVSLPEDGLVLIINQDHLLEHLSITSTDALLRLKERRDRGTFIEMELHEILNLEGSTDASQKPETVAP